VKKVRIYSNWVEFLSNHDFSLHFGDFFETSNYIDRFTVQMLLDLPDFEYETLQNDLKTGYTHIFDCKASNECFVRNVYSEKPFYVVYLNGKCTGKAYFSEEEAKKILNERKVQK